ncbi:MAG: PD-(D/E)XK nuclease family protein [Solobacterium sp.]|nr:PD-(D/E)XK nuclease family protein [Solobacterium sp.]
MISSLLKAAQFLKEYERSSTFIPNETERTFRRFAVSDHVRLNGTIDRISRDGANHMFEVIDYKSSSKTLSPASVKAGQQLQLLTYLCAAAELYGLEEDISPAGTYYFLLSADNITDAKKTAALSVNRNGFKLSERNLRTDDKQMKTLMIASRRLNGWTFTDRTDAIDGEGSYVNGLKNHYSYDSVRECLETLYEYFYENLTGENTEGKPDISVNPVEKACEYCDYKGICRYHGDGRKAQEIYQGKLTEERIKAE